MSALSGRSRIGLRAIVLFYLAALLLVPVGMIFYRTFEHGLSEPIDAVTSPEGMHAFWLTIVCVGIAVPLNTLFGVMTALVLVRQNFRGKALLNAAIDLPFVVREVMPVLQEIGTDQEEAAETLGANPWQTFWKVTLPAIRWGVTYGVVLATARALGEFGAVSVVAGNVSGSGGTQTLPLYVKDQFDNFSLAGAYAAALVLAVLAMAVLFGLSYLQKRSARNADADEDDFAPPTSGVFVPQPIKEA